MMDINDLVFRNIPPNMRGQYTVCPKCGVATRKQNYCDHCSAYIGQ
jgi:uncharacterized protein (DUF2225 family)